MNKEQLALGTLSLPRSDGDVIAADAFKDSYTAARANKEIRVWSRAELAFLGHLNPAYVMTQEMQRAFPGLAGKSEHTAHEARCSAEQVFFGTDNKLFCGGASEGFVKSRLAALKRPARAVGVTIRETTDTSDIAGGIYIIKEAAAAIILTANVQAHSPRPTYQQPERKELDHTITGFLQECFGTRLKAVFLYGSSVNEAGKDLDLIVVTDQFTVEDYRKINGAQKKMCHALNQPLGITIVTQERLPLVAKFSQSQIKDGRNIVQVLGEDTPLPAISTEELLSRELFKAAEELRRLRNAVTNPALVKDVEKSIPLLDYLLKLEVWITKSLMQQQEGIPIHKAEVIAKIGFQKFDMDRHYSPDEIGALLAAANHRVSERINSFMINHGFINRTVCLSEARMA
jgi:hypothetical protein